MCLSTQEFGRVFTFRVGNRGGIHCWVRRVSYEFDRLEEISEELLIVQEMCLQFMQLSREFDVIELKNIVLLTKVFIQIRAREVMQPTRALI